MSDGLQKAARIPLGDDHVKQPDWNNCEWRVVQSQVADGTEFIAPDVKMPDGRPTLPFAMGLQPGVADLIVNNWNRWFRENAQTVKAHDGKEQIARRADPEGIAEEDTRVGTRKAGGFPEVPVGGRKPDLPIPGPQVAGEDV